MALRRFSLDVSGCRRIGDDGFRPVCAVLGRTPPPGIRQVNLDFEDTRLTDVAAGHVHLLMAAPSQPKVLCLRLCNNGITDAGLLPSPTTPSEMLHTVGRVRWDSRPTLANGVAAPPPPAASPRPSRSERRRLRHLELFLYGNDACSRSGIAALRQAFRDCASANCFLHV